ncbi:MAG: bifunctional indole-3-glycerol phosphate synthase/phosphoribosylanthranilate isomerase [Spirochaetaceae bacterium]
MGDGARDGAGGPERGPAAPGRGPAAPGRGPAAPGRGFDILRRIADSRAARIAREGHELGEEVPATREVPVVGTATGAATGTGAGTGVAGGLLICEIKRRSPSRGEIDGVGDPRAKALEYAARGAQAVSVLTEAEHFGGSLRDLMEVKRALVAAGSAGEAGGAGGAGGAGHAAPGAAPAAAPAAPGGIPVLRKDFLLDEEDIEVSYRAGADIVLLIATLLDESRLARLHARATQLGMAALVELYTPGDAEKARAFAPELTGINSRDLTTFRVDRLHPMAVAAHVDWPTRLIYESGVFAAEDARLAAAAGFGGLLVGEAVVRNTGLIPALCRGLERGGLERGAAGVRRDPERAGAGRGPAGAAGAVRTSAGDFWSRLARRRGELRETGRRRPLVKICGITTRADAEAAVRAGADMLGFVFAESPRRAGEDLLSKLADLEVLKVAVVVAGGGRPVPGAVSRALESGLLDAVQLHGDEQPDECAELAFPYYKAVRLRSVEDVPRVAAYRSPRVLIDAFDRSAYGGTGRRIMPELVGAVAAAGPVWMAGGIGPENVGEIITRHRPELIDASSLLEAEPGRKDHAKLKTFFEEIDHAAGVQRLLR